MLAREPRTVGPGTGRPDEVADPITASVPRPAQGGHLGAVDVVRFLTVAGVILVHSTSLTLSYGSVAAGGVLDVAHVTRSVFLLLSAFVLTYSFDRRPLGARAFWRRRYPLVVVPYVTWSLIYVLTGGDLRSPAHVVSTFLWDLLDGQAHFHLYFLLLTMQLYLVFPAVMAALRCWPRVLVPALLASLAFQLLFTSAAHYGFWPSALRIWFSNDDSWLLSYLFYVVAGIAAARHLGTVTIWIRSHYRVVAFSWIASVVVSLAGYLLDLTVIGYRPLRASEVFQPTLVLAALTATAAQYALGLWFVDRLPEAQLRRLQKSSDVSFGVYLAHPLLIGGVLDVAVAAGAWTRLGHVPSGLGEAMVAFGLVPFIYAASFLAVAVARRTPFSLPVSGRKRLAPAEVGVTRLRLRGRAPIS
ncbi:MAG TPA: acyltransferase [Acidimicrobiales bacterium]|nr:acyltransferase [Acidimicrobiales bacterium]